MCCFYREYSTFSISFVATVLLLTTVSGTPEDPTLTFEDLFQYGKNEYTAKNWPDCVGFMRRAMEDYNYYNDEVLWCREKCAMSIPHSDGQRISVLYANAQRSLCLFRCKQERLTDQRPPLKKHLVWHDLEERKPYQYMHICYWHTGDLSNAVKAAYTYLVRHPDHQETLDNLQFYMKQDGFRENMLDDLLQKDYERLYIDGVGAYQEENWDFCVTKLELSLEKVLSEDHRCRLDCQDKIDWSSVEGTLEMDIIQTSMLSSVLRCETNCLSRLAWINGHNVGNLIASHFEYLHICQYNLMRGRDAAQSVSNYLLFDNSPAMRRNKFVYMKQYEKPDLFKPDEKMVDLHYKLTLEQRLLNFIDTRFKLSLKKELPAEMATDRVKMDEEVDIEDRFQYDLVERLVSKSECKLLRSTFRTTAMAALEQELISRVSDLFGLSVSLESSRCLPESRHPACSRSIVLSTEPQDCSTWLSPTHQGCSLVFCASDAANAAV